MLLTDNKKFALVSAVAVLTLLMWLGDVKFYTSLAGGGWFNAVYFGGLATCIFIPNIFAPSAIFMLWSKGRRAISVALIPACAVIFGLAIIASAGLVKLGHQEREAAGEHSRAAQSALHALELKEAALSKAGAFDAVTAQNKLAQARERISFLSGKAAECLQTNFKTNCLKERGGIKSVSQVQAEITALRAEVSSLDSGLRASKELLSTVQEKARAHAEYANAVTGQGTGDVAPIFITIASVTGTQPGFVRDAVIVISTTFVQIFLAVAWLFILHGKSFHTSTQLAYIPPASVLPALEKGGRVLKTGAAIVHAGEIVLNERATKEIDTVHPGLLDSMNVLKSTNVPSTNVLKESTNIPTKKNSTDSSTSVHTRYDTSTNPSQPRYRYEAVRAAVLKGEIAPTLAAIRAYRYGGMQLGYNPAMRFLNQLKSEGIIK